jgi:hypothetical protein
MGLLFAAALCALSSSAFAQDGGYIINTPGRLPTTVTPNFNGGYIVSAPGRMPTNVNPFGNGYIVSTPGRLPTTITPMFDDGYRGGVPSLDSDLTGEGDLTADQ